MKRAVVRRPAGAAAALAEFGKLERGALQIVASQTIAGYGLRNRSLTASCRRAISSFRLSALRARDRERGLIRKRRIENRESRCDLSFFAS